MHVTEKKPQKNNPQWHHALWVCACCVHAWVCVAVALSLGLGLSAGHWGGSSAAASVIWLADQNPFISSVTETHLEERRFIWTLLSRQSSQESYNQTCISFMPSGQGVKSLKSSNFSMHMFPQMCLKALKSHCTPNMNAFKITPFLPLKYTR